MALIAGTLNNASGVRPNTKIILTAYKTTSDVVTLAPDTTIITSATGAYSFECKPSFYNVRIQQPGYPCENVGIIQVYSDSADGTINEFLTTFKPDDLTPEILKQCIAAMESAEASAKIAQEESGKVVNATKLGLQVNNLHTTRDAITWKSGLYVEDPAQLYVYEGVEYLPNPKAMPFPFTTSATFDDDIASGKFKSGSLVTTSNVTKVAFPNTIFASDYVVQDWNGTTGTNNVIALKQMLTKLNSKSGQTLNIDCDFFIDINDASLLVQVINGIDREYALEVVRNKDASSIIGTGTVHYRNTSGKRTWLFVFNECYHPSTKYFKCDGGFTPTKTTVTTSTQHGVMFYNCYMPLHQLTTIEHIDGVPSDVTGEPRSPAITANTGFGARVDKNNFNYFEQNSTFGAGTSDYWFTNNLCKNHWLSGIKLSSSIADGAGSSVGRYKILNNIHDWDGDFETPYTYDGINKCFPHALQTEASGDLADYRGNTVDMTKITADNVNDKTTCIILSGSFSSDSGRWMRNVSICENQLIGNPHNTVNNLMSIAPAIYNLTVSNNPTFIGSIGIGTTNAINERRGKYTFANNGLNNNGKTSYYINKLVADKLLISGDIGGGDIFFTSLNDVINLTLKDIVNAKSIKMNNSTDRLKATSVKIYDCEAERMQVYCLGSLIKRFVVNGAVCVSQTGIGLDIKTDNQDCDVQLISLSTMGDGASGLIPTSFSLDAGRLRVGDIGMNANINTSFALGGDVVVRAGSLSKAGAPNFKAISGVRYTDLSNGDNYINTSVVPNSDAWKKISFT